MLRHGGRSERCDHRAGARQAGELANPTILDWSFCLILITWTKLGPKGIPNYWCPRQNWTLEPQFFHIYTRCTSDNYELETLLQWCVGARPSPLTWPQGLGGGGCFNHRCPRQDWTLEPQLTVSPLEGPETVHLGAALYRLSRLVSPGRGGYCPLLFHPDHILASESIKIGQSFPLAVLPNQMIVTSRPQGLIVCLAGHLEAWVRTSGSFKNTVSQ
ncbi:hypothetical protein RRG08_044166 [Elysia crispata]|uniref:Uncharacterized protein n=1 Tax=Elysia crispata TaxID=231223 RepID=A0AAE1CNQ9_9GAST|nr:hypothetical protein RRG08_044166 [Elysia crispata]